jgi:glycosyltransferase involved in cell wall biosynthesis
MGERGRKKVVREFSWKSVARKMLSTYRKVL